jgi:hypothetical protein
MFSLLQSSVRRYNAHAEGWGSDDTHSATLDSPGNPDPIPGNSARTVVVKLMSSFFVASSAEPTTRSAGQATMGTSRSLG